MLSGTLLYIIPPGLVRIGKNVPTHKLEAFKQLDILLDGPLVRELHWLVNGLYVCVCVCVCVFYV